MKDYENLVTTYVLGELNGEELIQFETELARNLELKNAVEFERTILYSAQKNNFSSFLRKTLNQEADAQENNKNPEGGKVISFKAKLRWIAGIAAMILIISTVFVLTRNTNENQLYAETVNGYIFPLKGAKQFMGPGTDTLKIETNLKTLEFRRHFNAKEIEQEHIKEAIVYLNSGELTMIEQAQLQFEIAIAQLETAQFEQASRSLKRAREISNSGEFEVQPTWYCSLDYLEQLIKVKEYNNPELSISLLENNPIDCQKLKEYQDDLIEDLGKLK